MAPEQPWTEMRLSLGDGATFLFWVDPWLDGKHIFEFAPKLFDTILVRHRRRLMVAAALDDMCWVRDIKGALTISVLMQYVLL
jgi:hypothetical protein